MKQMIRLSARNLVQTYVIYGSVNDNVISMLARNGYKTPLPADIVDAIEGVKSLHQQRRELYARIMRLKDAKRRNRGWLPNHTTTCDNSYQDRLELLLEIRDIENNLDEMEAEINRLKTIAKL